MHGLTKNIPFSAVLDLSCILIINSLYDEFVYLASLYTGLWYFVKCNNSKIFPIDDRNAHYYRRNVCVCFEKENKKRERKTILRNRFLGKLDRRVCLVSLYLSLLFEIGMLVSTNVYVNLKKTEYKFFTSYNQISLIHLIVYLSTLLGVQIRFCFLI